MAKPQTFVESIASTLARSELFRSALSTPGDVVECGVLTGDGLMLWSALIEIFAPNSSKRVVAFDTFDGFPTAGDDQTENDRARTANEVNHDAAISVEAVSRRLVANGLDSRVDLVPGDAMDTIPDFLRHNRGLRVGVLNLDFDLYAPTRIALAHLLPRMVPGGYVLIDNFGTRKWGETDAADEILKAAGINYESIPWTRNPRAFARIPHGFDGAKVPAPDLASPS